MARPSVPARAWCPKCGHKVAASTITTGGRGYCERDGWQWVDWHPPEPKPPRLHPAGVRVW